MLIRNMVREDIDSVLEIEQECFTQPWTKNMFLGELAQPVTLYRVAVVDGTPVGYMGMYRIVDEGHITNIAVKKAFRGRGIGSCLMESFLQLGEDGLLSFLTLEVRESNQKAIRLYQKYGFRQVGRRPRYYENAEDALLMTRYFEQEDKRNG